MNVLVTGACGFVGSTVLRGLREHLSGVGLYGVDNLIRPGSEINRRSLLTLGVALVHGDVRSASDLDQLPAVDWVVDAAANASVIAGVDGRTSSRQIVEHNLYGTVNLLEFCKRHGAGFVLLSTSRVYSIAALAALPVESDGERFRLCPGSPLPAGATENGVAENFSTAPPLSLYGCAKLASEALALEYGEAFGFPVWIDRCGVLAGGGQFGRVDQGIFAYWINAWMRDRPLTYLGFGGLGHQVRDCLHPRDLMPLLMTQMGGRQPGPRTVNVGGGPGRAVSLRQLSEWCRHRFGPREVASDPRLRAFDIPWMVMDSSLARQAFGWQPAISLEAILEEVARHAEQHPDWLDISAQP